MTGSLDQHPGDAVVDRVGVHRLSIVVPALNEAAGIEEHLGALQVFRRAGAEIIVVDGGSVDGTVELAAPLVDQVVRDRSERARQMNAGALASHGDLLLFLHADTRLPPDAALLIGDALSRDSCWGRFDVLLVGRPITLRVVSALMNRRSRLSGIATGDQAMFMTRAAFEHVGGFPEFPLMEDIEMSKRLKRLSTPACLAACVESSGRRWEQQGTWRTILLMWSLRFGYWCGISPWRLAARYRQIR